MTNHRLTDEIVQKLSEKVSETDWNDCDEYEESLFARAAYDLAVEQITEQWEEVINSNKTDIQVIREFDKRLKAMRPQEDTS